MSSAHLVIRADADARIGGGHLMRCSAFAQAWKSRGGDVTFLSHCSSPDLLRRLESAGLTVISIAEAHPAPFDLQRTLSVLEQRAVSDGAECWLAIDGYHFDHGYQQAIREAGHRVLIIDDMAHLSHYHADLLVNQNFHANTLNYRCDPHTELLLGARYAMLRPEFGSWSYWRREIPATASKIVVTLGTGDADNVTLAVIRALQSETFGNTQIRVIIGAANQHLEALRQAVAESVNFELLADVKDMPSQFAWADLAVAGAGSTCWELAFMGLPFILISTAENQAQIAQALEADGLALNLGGHDQLSTEKIISSVQVLRETAAMRREMSERLRQLVDGKGSLRVVETVLAKMKSNHARSISGK